MGAPECSVSSDTKKLTDVLAFKAVNDFTNILGTRELERILPPMLWMF